MLYHTDYAHAGCYLQTTSRSQLSTMKSDCEIAVEILKVSSEDQGYIKA